MSSKWDSGIIVWRADGQMQVLKEGNDGVYVVDPNQKGCPVVLRYHDIMFSTIKVPRSVLRAGSHVPLWALPSEACPVRYGSALAAALEKANGSCGSRRTATARTTFTHAVINMMQRRWRSAYLSMPIDANQGNNRPPRNLPSVIPHPNR